MENDILQSVLKKCRNALLSGVPIVYIRTDSDVFIRNLVMEEKNPLVVLRYNGVGDKQDRPIYEVDEKNRRPENCTNYKDYILSANDVKQTPFICAKKIRETDYNSLTLLFNSLEKYVANHENEKLDNYNLLQSSLIILYSSEVFLTPMLRTYTEIIELEYPDEKEIRQIIKSIVGNELENCIGDKDDLSKLCTDLRGFTSEEIAITAKKILALSSVEELITEYGDKQKLITKIVNNRKMQKLEGGLLEQCKTESNIAGMERFRKWLETQKDPLIKSHDFKTQLGTNPPNGVLLCGIPGCGKSEAAKFAATIFKMPMLKMDIGSLMDKYQGESERKMRDALKMAEAMSPCVLLIDEIEKGFSGAGSDGDSSAFKRMFGYMLGWMQDNTSPCFIFATANDISVLPKEFFRSGRFDALYAVFLPTAEECSKIFLSCIEKAEENVKKANDCAELFDDSCKNERLYLDIINKCLIKNGKPRMIIGSDIQKAVEIAIRSLSKEVFDGKIIEKQKWEKALINALNNIATYGEGEENLDSIVLGYCRMLRKGFISTSDKPMFESKDYCPERLLEIEKIKEKVHASPDPDEIENLKNQLKNCKILAYRDISESGLVEPYDKAVYDCLYDRINSVAYELEKIEKEKMIRR